MMPGNVSYYTFGVSCDVTADVHRTRKSRNMCGKIFYIHSQCGTITAKALRTYACLIYCLKHLTFEKCIPLIAVGNVNITAESNLGQQCTLFKGSADTDAYHHRRTWVSARNLYSLCDKINDILL